MRFYTLLVLVTGLLSGCSYLPEPVSLPAGTTLTEDRTSIAVSAAGSTGSTTGFLFYPGALVDPHAYMGLMQQLAAAGPGYRVFIAKVPANLAVLQPDAAAPILAAHPDIKNWVIGGHSLGGAMACTWVNRQPASVRGLVLMAAYPAKSDDLSGWLGGVLSVYGTNDKVLDMYTLSTAYARLPASTITVQINGGNHAQFGAYGDQSGDGTPTISRADQQQLTVRQFVSFMNTLGL
jgi:hypothetical protein